MIDNLDIKVEKQLVQTLYHIIIEGKDNNGKFLDNGGSVIVKNNLYYMI